MKTKVVTALFDIGREKYDGRSIENYLDWFAKTLQLNCEFVVFTEDKFKDFVFEHCPSATVIIQKLEEIPYYELNDTINRIIHSAEYRSKMLDTDRIECNLSLYNVIQYSKFGWLSHTMNRFPDYDRFFWMDAGCSRFFEDVDISKPWPAKNILDDKVIIQNNVNFNWLFPSLSDEYIWSNQSIVVGTLFGGSRGSVSKLIDNIKMFLARILSKNIINNEQFALAYILKYLPNNFLVYSELNGTHLPLFKYLATE